MPTRYLRDRREAVLLFEPRMTGISSRLACCGIMAAVDDVSKIIMNTQAHTYPVRTRKSDELLAISATTYLLLGVAFSARTSCSPWCSQRASSPPA